MHIFCKSLREEADARDANFRNGKHEKKKDFAPNAEFKYGQRTQHLIHWHAELCTFLSANAIMSPDLSGRCRDSRKSAESCRMKGLNVTGGQREEGGVETYTYTLGIYRSRADSERGVLAAVPAGPRVSDRGNWLLPTPATLYLASEGRTLSENCINYGNKCRLAQTKQPLGKENQLGKSTAESYVIKTKQNMTKMSDKSS